MNFNCIPSVLYETKLHDYFVKYIKGYYGIEHFAVNVIYGSMKICLCSNANYILDYSAKNMSYYSSGYYSNITETLTVVPWRLLCSENDIERLKTYTNFKEKRHGLFSGMSFIKKYDDFKLNIAVASKSIKIDAGITFLNNSEHILNLGAFIYNEFASDMSSVIDRELPKVKNSILLSDRQYQEIDFMKKSLNDSGIFFADRRLFLEASKKRLSI